MENFDIDNIEDIITDWYFTNNDEMNRLSIEFVEITKDTEEGTFDFMFNWNSHLWHLKYEFSTFYFESDGEKESDLVAKCNELIEGVDEPNQGVIQVLEWYVNWLKEIKKKGTAPNQKLHEEINADMNINSDQDDDEGEGEDIEGWSDEDYEEDIDEPSMKKQSSSVNNQIERYSMNLGNKESIKLFNQWKVVINAKNLQKLIEKHLEKLSNSFQVQMFDPLLMFKFTIDLNFLNQPHTIYESLGFEMEELVEYLFIFDENKLLMFWDDPSFVK